MTKMMKERPLAGTIYRLVRRIGAGSSSEVFEALGRRGEPRALKILRAAHAGAREATARLFQEARALAALDHPHVVRIDDAGVTADGRPFLVMPLLVGETLRERLTARGPLAPRAAAQVTREVLGALSAAHRAGIVHRDVKPANVFIGRPGAARPAVLGRSRRERWGTALGRVTLIDFGVAKLSWGATDLTTGAHVVGTPRYLAPEQILGGQVDARTDVYAAGLLLFEAIAGRAAFPSGDALEVMRAHLHAPAPRLRDVTGAPRALDHVVARALHKTPALRWQTAQAMADALAEACGDAGDAGGAGGASGASGASGAGGVNNDRTARAGAR